MAKSFALLVGINEYRLVNPLAFARNDAEDTAKVLVECCDFDPANVTLMTCRKKAADRSATQWDAERQLACLAGKIGPEDFLLFGFFGHGVVSGDQTYLLLSDSDNSTPQSLLNSALSLGVIREKLKQIQAQRTLLILDCCRSPIETGRGPSECCLSQRVVEAARALSRDIEAVNLDRGTQPREFAAIFACQPGKRAFEWEEKRHGIFAHHLIEGLRGEARKGANGPITLDSLDGYLQKKVPETSTRLWLAEQKPFCEAMGATGMLIVPETSPTRAAESSKGANGMEQLLQAACLPWNLEYNVLNAYVEGSTTAFQIRVTPFARIAHPEYSLNVACDKGLAVVERAIERCTKKEKQVEICQNVRPVSGAQDAILTVNWGWRGRFGMHWFEGVTRVGKVFEKDSASETVVGHIINTIEELRASGKAVFEVPTPASRKVRSEGISSAWQTIRDELERRSKAKGKAADVPSICNAARRRGKFVWAPLEMHECDAPDDIEGTVFVTAEEGDECRYHVLHKPQLSFGREWIEEQATDVSLRNGAGPEKRSNDVVIRNYELDEAGNPILPKAGWTEEERRDFKKKMKDANGMISRKHFELKEEEGNLVLDDRSKFGTTVNGAKVAQGCPVALREGEKAEIVCGESLRMEVEVKGRHDEPGLSWDCLAWDGVGYRCVYIRQPEHSARQEYLIVGTQLLIGSGNGCDIRLRGDGVAEVHCRVFRAYGELWLESLAEGFSTTVGEEELPAHVPMHLDGPVRVGVATRTLWFGPYCPIVVGYDYVSGWTGVTKGVRPSPPVKRKEPIRANRIVHCAECGKELATEYAVGGVCKQAGCSNVLCRRHWREEVPFCPEHVEKREARIRELREKGIELLTEDEVAASKVAIFSEIDAAMFDAVVIYDPLQNKDIPIGKVDKDRKHVQPTSGAGEFPEMVIYTFSRRRSLARRKVSPVVRVGVCFCFDQEHMNEHGYITGPAGQRKLNHVLNWLLEQAHACCAPSVFCLFSPTGWETGPQIYVEREFQDRWLHLCLRGRKEEFIAHRDDPAAGAFLPILCGPRFRQEVVSRIKPFIDARLETSFEGVTVNETVRKLDVPRRHVETAFRLLAKEQSYDLTERAGHGLVISRTPSEEG